MRHRIDHVVNADADAESGEFFRILWVVGVLPRIAQVHVVADRDHQTAVIVVDTAPVWGLAAFTLLVHQAAEEELLAGNLIALVEVEYSVKDAVRVGYVDDLPIREDLL